MTKNAVMLLICSGLFQISLSKMFILKKEKEAKSASNLHYEYFTPAVKFDLEDNKYLLNKDQFEISEGVGPKDLDKFNYPDPLLAAMFLSARFHVPGKYYPGNNSNQPPINPYIALFLSHYGRYLPIYGYGKGLYGYGAANNYHNNKPFGAYKINEEH